MRKKLVLKPIEDANRKKVTLSKRKKGIFRKLIELSILCDIDIFMVIFDREK
jgi:MADS-box transcription factor